MGVNSESSDTCPLGHAMGRPSQGHSAVPCAAQSDKVPGLMGVACHIPDTLNASYLMRGILFFFFFQDFLFCAYFSRSIYAYIHNLLYI